MAERGEEPELPEEGALVGDTKGPILAGLNEKLLAGEKRDCVLEGGGGGGGGDAGGVDVRRVLAFAAVERFGVGATGTGDTEEEDVAEALEDGGILARDWNIVEVGAANEGFSIKEFCSETASGCTNRESSAPDCCWDICIRRGDSIDVETSDSLSYAAMFGRPIGKKDGDPTTGDRLLAERSSSAK